MGSGPSPSLGEGRFSRERRSCSDTENEFPGLEFGPLVPLAVANMQLAVVSI